MGTSRRTREQRRMTRSILVVTALIVGAAAIAIWYPGARSAANTVVTVHKSASCGCCKLWVQHLRTAGFSVAPRDRDDLNAVKQRVGVPASLSSCHTAEVDGYFVEGHVPVEDIKRLLRERPDAKGLTVPGMPIGSPGMELGNRRDPYDVLLVHADGRTSVFSHHGK